MWMAWPCCRFPRLLSRQILRGPQDTSIGAVPLQAAKGVPAAGAGHAADVAGDGGGGGPGAVQPGQARPGRRDGDGGLLAGLTDPGRSPADAAARSQRATSTAPAGVTDSGIRAAPAAVIALETPPGISPHSTARRRQTTWVRLRPRSRCRLDQISSTAA